MVHSSQQILGGEGDHPEFHTLGFAMHGPSKPREGLDMVLIPLDGGE
jgi:hypothetical protein